MQKRLRKGCDWLIANDVGEGSQVMGGDSNQVLLVTAAGTDPWPPMDKTLVAARLVKHITEYFS